tara:strand:- start:932 stop:1378 length:447 start_codon:yes stop_codon:yes gene_type:complete
MASPLKTARDTITTIWEGLTPPTDTARTYHKITGRQVLDGASGHRCFWFDPPTGGNVESFATAAQQVRHAVTANIKLSSAGAGVDEVYDDVADEAALLLGGINLYSSSWPSGVVHASATGYEATPIESDDVLLAIAIDIITQETDGAT